jgi:lysophospholipase L1-like esterase
MSIQTALLAIAICLVCVSLGCAARESDASLVIMDMDTIQHSIGVFGEEKAPVGTVELVDGKFGKACRFSFVEGSQSGFFTAQVATTPDWDAADGIGFWVKGDGSDSWGGLHFIDANDWGYRYGYWFPIDSTEWTKITVPWHDLIPERPNAPLIDPEGDYKPSRLGRLYFGKRIRWWEFPAHSFAVDQIALEPTLPTDAADYAAESAGAARFLRKLKAGEPVTIVTMGDSLSDKHHWANHDLLWSEIVAENIRQAYGVEVSLMNPAVGGSQLTHGLITMPRWVRTTPQPDLVTVWFGGNDWSEGMRGEKFRELLRFAVDRIRRMTRGGSDILLITSIPSLASWDDRGEMAEAVRVVAREKKTALADVDYVFHEIAQWTDRKPQLYAWDEVHLGGYGHHVVADTVFKAMARGE